MKRREIIKKIHNSPDTYGIFVEMGCGSALASALLSVPGASNTVFFSECPYSKEKQEELYGKTSRAVSLERVRSVIQRYIGVYDPVDTIYAASFQLSEDGTKATHGWIGVWRSKSINGKSSIKYYHLTIPVAESKLDIVNDPIQTREVLMKVIENNALFILSGECSEESQPAFAVYLGLSDYMEKSWHSNIDMILSEKDNGSISQTPDDQAAVVNNIGKFNVLAFSGGKFVRPEDLLRKDNVVIYKGSFNPIHNGHAKMIARAEEKFKVKPLLALSMETYGKDRLDGEHIVARALALSDMGYDVLVFQSGFFNENQRSLRTITKGKINYLMGSDTVERILSTSYTILPTDENAARRKDGLGLEAEMDRFAKEFESSNFFVIDRMGFTQYKPLLKLSRLAAVIEPDNMVQEISSTEIRQAADRGDWGFVKNNVPDGVYNSLKRD